MAVILTEITSARIHLDKEENVTNRIAIISFALCILLGFSSVAGAAMELAYLTATGSSGAVEIAWGTASETDNAGFNILRSLDSLETEFVPINVTLIPAEGGPSQGADYSYIDNDVQGGSTYLYILEDMDIYEESTHHGPVAAAPVSIQPCWPCEPASTVGAEFKDSSNAVNYLFLLVVPIGAVIAMRLIRRKK